MPELRKIGGDRQNLLVQVAGILLGASEGQLDEPRSKAAASFCIAAGADDSLIPLVFTPPLLRRGEGLAECVSTG